MDDRLAKRVYEDNFLDKQKKDEGDISLLQKLYSNPLGTILTGLSTATSSVINATDSILIAIGKLQAQITSVLSSISTIISTILSQNTGWIEVTDTWTYASINTINIPSDGTLIYQKGIKIRFTQGGVVKYLVGSLIAPTLITVFVNTNYTVANSPIIDIKYSYIENPYGWPDYFALGTPTWSTVAPGAAFTNQPGSNSFIIKFIGHSVRINGSAITNLLSGGTGIFLATFPTGSIPNCITTYATGVAANFSTTVLGHSFVVTNGIYLCKYDKTAIAGNSELFEFNIMFEW